MLYPTPSPLFIGHFQNVQEQPSKIPTRVTTIDFNILSMMPDLNNVRTPQRPMEEKKSTHGSSSKPVNVQRNSPRKVSAFTPSHR